MPEKDTDLAGRLRKWVVGEEAQDIWGALEEAFFRERDNGIGAPVPKGGEPQIPVETGLIRRVDARRLMGILRLEAKRIGDPIFAVIGTLKFDFVAPARHYGE